MRRSLVRVAVFAGLLIGLASPASAVTTCLNIAVPLRYRCDFTGADGTHSNLCMFATAEFPPLFHLSFPAPDIFVTCACEATGTFLAPKFDQSKAFLCRGINADDTTFALRGQVTGHNITKGQVVSPRDGNRLVFQCKPDPTC